MVDLKSNILVITLHIYGLRVSIRRQRSWKLSLKNRTICYLQDTHEILNLKKLKTKGLEILYYTRTHESWCSYIRIKQSRFWYKKKHY